MHAGILSHLSSLYSPASAVVFAEKLDAMLHHFRTSFLSEAHKVAGHSLTQRDAILITYADQLSEQGVSPLQSLVKFADRHLTNVLSGVHILPFYPWSSDDGFSVKDYYQVDRAYGTWSDIATLGRHFDLMFDAVINHMSAESDWFKQYLAGNPAFHDFFIDVRGGPDLSAVIRPRALPLLTEFAAKDGARKVWTTFSRDQVDLNFHEPAVLLKSVEILLHYVAHGARFIRLDAIAFLWKEQGTSCLHRPQTHTIIQLWRAVLDEVAPSVQLITETNVPHVDNISYFGDGSNEAQLVYNFALPPLVLHSLQTGEGAKLTAWARSLCLTSDRTTFFNFLASHDGIGINPARGILDEQEIASLVRRTMERGGRISYKNLPDGTQAPYEMNINYLDALISPDDGKNEGLGLQRFLVAHAIMLSLQGMPALYFHSLMGSRGDQAGVEASGMNRRINREKLKLVTLETELADPCSRRARIFKSLRDLLALRQAHTAFAPQASQLVLDLHTQMFAVLRKSHDGSDCMLCLHNLSNTALFVRTPYPGNSHITLAPYGIHWSLIQ